MSSCLNMPSAPCLVSATRMIEPPQGTVGLITMPGLAGTPTGRRAPVIRPSAERMFRPVCTISRHTGSRFVFGRAGSPCFCQNGSTSSVQPWLSGSANPVLLGKPCPQ